MNTSYNHSCIVFMTISFSISVLFFSCSAYAQTMKTSEDLKKLTPEQRAKMLTDSMKVRLLLKDQQYESIYIINLKYAKKAEPILKGTDNKVVKYYKINSMQSDKEAEYKKLLTELQFKKYMEFKDSMMKRAMNRM